MTYEAERQMVIDVIEALAAHVDDSYTKGVLTGTVDMLHHGAIEPRMRARWRFGELVERCRVMPDEPGAVCLPEAEGPGRSQYTTAARLLDALWWGAVGDVAPHLNILPARSEPMAMDCPAPTQGERGLHCGHFYEGAACCHCGRP